LLNPIFRNIFLFLIKIGHFLPDAQTTLRHGSGAEIGMEHHPGRNRDPLRGGVAGRGHAHHAPDRRDMQMRREETSQASLVARALRRQD
jgi:hypothetical protein